jgi:hemolysin activation/secretion protein
MIHWKHALSLCLGLVLGVLLPTIRGAEAGTADPADTATHAVPNASAPAAPATGPGAASERRRLRHILIAESVEAAQALQASFDSPFVVLSPGLAAFDAAELNKRLSAGVNQPIEERILAAIAHVIEAYFRQNEHPTAAAIVPTQSIAEGDVRIIVLLGTRTKDIATVQWKIRNIKVQGAHWFSESLLREKLRIEQGERIRYGDLDRAISWTNNNPYRKVHVQLDPVPNSSGEADLSIAVQETLPLRLSLSYSNSGNEAIGKNQYTAAVSYANLWGRDHQISYQYSTTDRLNVFQAQGFDYRVPLPWRHYLQFSASYMRAKPEFERGLFAQNGQTTTGDLRYTIPLRTGDNPTEVYATLNFKESNNNIAFGGSQVFLTKTDVFQLTLGGSTIMRDRRGGWAFGASLTGSPGNINSRNTDRAFDALRFGMGDSARLGARAEYLYGSVSVQRLLQLAPGWDLSSRTVAQISQANLLSSEQLGIGGVSTVRGFPESIFTGDNGFVFSNELLLPSWKRNLPRISKARGPLDTRPLLFLDMGKVSAHQTFATDPKRVTLASSGIGVRMSLATNFSLSADYGWQITYLPYSLYKSRGHIRATLAF